MAAEDGHSRVSVVFYLNVLQKAIIHTLPRLFAGSGGGKQQQRSDPIIFYPQFSI